MKKLDSNKDRLQMNKIVNIIGFKIDDWNGKGYVKFHTPDGEDESSGEVLYEAIYWTNIEIVFNPIFIHDLREYIEENKPFYKEDIINAFLISNTWDISNKLLLLLEGKKDGI